MSRPGGRPVSQSKHTLDTAADTTADTPAHHMAMASTRTEGSAHERRTVNPLMVPARYNFLCSSQGRPCGRPPAAAVLTVEAAEGTGDRTGLLVEFDRTDTLFTIPSTGAPRTM